MLRNTIVVNIKLMINAVTVTIVTMELEVSTDSSCSREEEDGDSLDETFSPIEASSNMAVTMVPLPKNLFKYFFDVK